MLAVSGIGLICIPSLSKIYLFTCMERNELERCEIQCL